MVYGPRLLARHLTASGLSLRDFADMVGASCSLVWMWRKGARTPGIDFALRIEQATGGRIRPKHWVDTRKRVAH
jgi:transcriptional regulator with XRE-family HTH domain